MQYFGVLLKSKWNHWKNNNNSEKFSRWRSLKQYIIINITITTVAVIIIKPLNLIGSLNYGLIWSMISLGVQLQLSKFPHKCFGDRPFYFQGGCELGNYHLKKNSCKSSCRGRKYCELRNKAKKYLANQWKKIHAKH